MSIGRIRSYRPFHPSRRSPCVVHDRGTADQAVLGRPPIDCAA